MKNKKMKIVDTIPLLEITECFNNISNSKIKIMKLMKMIKKTVDTIPLLEITECSQLSAEEVKHFNSDGCVSVCLCVSLSVDVCLCVSDSLTAQALQLSWVCVCVCQYVCISLWGTV
jgi:hypothetical protein